MTAEAALRRALLSMLADSNFTATIGNIRSDSWASATFSGTRHELLLHLSNLSGCDPIAGIGEREFDLPGHILIDIAAAEIGRDGEESLWWMEALTVEAD